MPRKECQTRMSTLPKYSCSLNCFQLQEFLSFSSGFVNRRGTFQAHSKWVQFEAFWRRLEAERSYLRKTCSACLWKFILVLLGFQTAKSLIYMFLSFKTKYITNISICILLSVTHSSDYQSCGETATNMEILKFTVDSLDIIGTYWALKHVLVISGKTASYLTITKWQV